MSEELNDEVEAINSIYGDGSLVPYPADNNTGGGESDTYILQLPGEDPSSLRLQFPPAYPAEPPSVLGTHSAGENARRGAAARDLRLFRDAVAAVYQPGQVCLFDALEELSRQLEALQEAAAAAEDPEEASPPPSDAYGNDDGDDGHAAAAGDDLGPEPAWTLSDPIAENKSVFLARAAPASSPAEAARCVAHLLATDRRARAATHNITAWRIRSSSSSSGATAAATVFQDCDDDGETAAGGRLLHLLQLMDAWGLVVVVTRWYGGQKLGPRRFALINQAARDAVVKGGFVAGADPPAQQGGGKKKGHGK